MVDSLYEISRVLLLCLGFGSANLIGKAAITGGVVLGRAHALLGSCTADVRQGSGCKVSEPGELE